MELKSQQKILTKIDKAKELAKELHTNQKYGVYDYYKYHLLGVYNKVVESGYDENHQIVALLHDVHEDHSYPLDLIQSIYGYDVSKAVEAISYKKGVETRAEYYQRCIKNDIAKVVKRFDAQFNKEQSISDNDNKRALYYEEIENMMYG